jgi:hypothetical protein
LGGTGGEQLFVSDNNPYYQQVYHFTIYCKLLEGSWAGTATFVFYSRSEGIDEIKGFKFQEADQIEVSAIGFGIGKTNSISSCSTAAQRLCSLSKRRWHRYSQTWVLSLALTSTLSRDHVLSQPQPRG